ncbi:MAG: hypothetical protein HC879_04750 [Leptolyngbyaceae cyanobacterium SL_5_9]|nr:hypothetical protein [Leptolyngbyaceae cyanobacterium SL_5_9]NJO73966.1 hypothetical protein [Leptolyngbyaceae cyanobacterium RM1_406_9]
MQSKSQKFDEQTIKAILKRCWSRESSSLWTKQNPACGQCGVTALVIQDQFGGGILKTPTEGGWHFYNQIDGERYDLTIEQFTVLPNYMDLPSNREEAFANTNQNQYSYLSSKFRQMLR